MNNTKRSKNKRYILYCLIFLLALCVRIIRLIIAPLLSRDAVQYLNQAVLWSQTNDYSSFLRLGINPQPPLPIWTIKKLMFLGFGAETSGRALGIFTGALIPVIGFVLAEKITKNIFVGIVSASILILHPSLIAYSIQPLRENYYLLFSCLFLVYLTEAVKRNASTYWLGCGLIMALCFFCRYEAIELAFITPLLIILLRISHRITTKDALKNELCCIIGIAIATTLLLSMVDYDCSFISKINMYTNIME